MSKPTTSAPASIAPRPMVPSPQNKSYITGLRPCVWQRASCYGGRPEGRHNSPLGLHTAAFLAESPAH
eukprot:1363761-Pleurochrysis_carterae.AAC.1